MMSSRDVLVFRVGLFTRVALLTFCRLSDRIHCRSRSRSPLELIPRILLQSIFFFPNGVRFLFVFLFFGFAYPLVALGRSVEIFGTRVHRDVYLSQFSFPCMYTIFSFLLFSFL